MKDDPGPKVFGVIYLDQRGGGGHDDGGLHPCGLGRIGYALGVVPRRGGDQALGFLLVGEGTQLIVRAPDFVGPCHLHIFRFNVYIVSSGLRKCRTVNQVGVGNDPRQYPAGGFEIFQRHHWQDILSRVLFILMNYGRKVNVFLTLRAIGRYNIRISSNSFFGGKCNGENGKKVGSPHLFGGGALGGMGPRVSAVFYPALCLSRCRVGAGLRGRQGHLPR
ncbi:hypothetical protein KL86CLO1_10425 [uncultured Eubacteriales bacterium]|uniref:Uncharacterized protein n=1 Tax=uncultured Eubacteriales bacterium TaxID=172733 RepID=A0A212J3M7_9FIRM|nr:hypothetical protein KL86CLO1_10425 [uncultured Eubacteriales bacterium]